ncbi:histone-lysine N-methyltransferase, H3 lysine-9 specific SUVH1-like [Hibiscus syriacus]|uniref:histone-lysine N-methyltransferase, H3 lysine-9 specific SUVH1-like n=1 Tax=Hibiscus syriacus TaxID=106335 RepID=UPI00192053C6|nr:histone-lysine N-methyltransferase, H3 lysine-9 specific SUVH1-like [Hibiscus syriacus]
MMSKGVRTNTRKRIGFVPGVEIGDIFFFRLELCLVGLHAQCMAGIDPMPMKGDLEGERVAVSIVSSGGYDDDVEDTDVLVYTGHGGNASGDKEASDQKLVRGNLALEKNLHRANEVRVIRGFQDTSHQTSKVYVYDGLYKKWKGLPSRDGLILPDLTSGAESIPVSLPIMYKHNHEVLFHITFFAKRHIPPMTEVTYDYGNPHSDESESNGADYEKRNAYVDRRNAKAIFIEDKQYF